MLSKFKPAFWLLVAGLVALHWHSSSPEEVALVFRAHGVKVQMLTQERLEAISPPVVLDIYEPHVEANRSYRAIPLEPVLKSVYGESWQAGGTDLVFTGKDGYQSCVRVGKFERFPAFLAFAMSGDEPFELVHARPPKKRAVLGPYYLIWDLHSSPDLPSDESYYWPYQVVDVDLIDFQERYPALTPPEESAPEVIRGFQAYRSYCMTCHMVDGGGGSSGPELNTPDTLPSLWVEGGLETYLLDPQSVVPGIQMPALDHSLPDRERTARDIVRYLEYLERSVSNEPEDRSPEPSSPNESPY